MPSTPYAKILVSVNGGANVSGGIDAPSAATLDLTPESIVGWEQWIWEIVDYPEGFETPAGWTLATDGRIFYSGPLTTPPQIALPSALALYGVWMFRLRINAQVSDDQKKLGDLIDDTTAVSLLHPLGFRGVGAREKDHFTSITTRIKRWLRSIQTNLRLLGQTLTCLKLNANYTNNAVTATNTNLRIPVKAGEIWEIEFRGTVQCSSTGGVRFAVSAPVGSTVEGWLQATANALGTPATPQRITAVNTLTTATSTVATTPAPVTIRALVVCALDGFIGIDGAVQTAAQVMTLFANSVARFRLVAGV